LPAPHFVWSSGAGSIAATKAPTQLSTASPAEPVSSNEMQSLPTLFSSFSKQPLAGSTPPFHLIVALSTQAFAFGSGILPGVSASCSHLIRPVPNFDMHFVLPARHFVCWADAALADSTIRPRASPATIERTVMSPPVRDR
jgi:hypothetical protein